MTADTQNPTAVMLLSCPDKKGIVASVSNFIFKNNGNIVHAEQYTDKEDNVFFMRIEWELNGFNIPRAEILNSFKPISENFQMKVKLHFSDEITNTAIFVTKEPHCLYELLYRHQTGEINTNIKLIISNHEYLKPIAEYFKIPFYHIPKTRETRAEAELKEFELLRKNGIDLIILARYMQILSPEYIKRYPMKIINIHHSFLPAFVGSRPYERARARGVKIIGATAHYVTEELDQGPIIEQDVIRVSHRDDVEKMKQKGKDIEKLVLVRAVKLHLEHRIIVYKNRTIVFDT